MKKGAIWIVLTCLMVISLVLASCAKTTITSTATSTTTSTMTTSTTATTAIGTETTTATSSVVTTTVSSTGHWWDSLGTPQYGGEMNCATTQNPTNWGALSGYPNPTCIYEWQDELTSDIWTLDPAEFNYELAYTPANYATGNLAQNWEFTDLHTLVFHIRQGAYWQNKPPVNGRELTSADVVYHYDRLLGMGDGFTTPTPFYSGVSSFQAAGLTSITAPDKFTVVFTWTSTNPEVIMELMLSPGPQNNIGDPIEVVQAYGDTNDWHYATGTGPFILKDFVDSSSVALVKNPNYWGYDERYPQNRLPYIDKISILIIANSATSLAALRTGKIDSQGGTLTDSIGIKKTNPGILQVTIPGNGATVDPRTDTAPYTDIRVREALQEALDLKTIASTYYLGTVSPNPSSMISQAMTGWCSPYSQWPQALKDQFAYNPTNAKQLLTAAGYPNGFNTDIIASSSADQDLLLIVQSSFLTIGVNMSIRVMDPTSFTTYSRGKKADALVYSNNEGYSFEPLMAIRHWMTNSPNNWSMTSDPVFDGFDTSAINATSLDQMEQIFQQADLYVAQHQWEVDLPVINSFTFYQPWLKGFSGQLYSLGGGMKSGLYTARFWIDQDVKKASGH